MVFVRIDKSSAKVLCAWNETIDEDEDFLEDLHALQDFPRTGEGARVVMPDSQDDGASEVVRVPGKSRSEFAAEMDEVVGSEPDADVVMDRASKKLSRRRKAQAAEQLDKTGSDYVTFDDLASYERMRGWRS